MSTEALPLGEEVIERAAIDMMSIYGMNAATKAEEYVRQINSDRAYSLARTWETIRDKIIELQKTNSKPRNRIE